VKESGGFCGSSHIFWNKVAAMFNASRVPTLDQILINVLSAHTKRGHL
jgi:hypothetical protein